MLWRETSPRWANLWNVVAGAAITGLAAVAFATSCGSEQHPVSPEAASDAGDLRDGYDASRPFAEVDVGIPPALVENDGATPDASWDGCALLPTEGGLLSSDGGDAMVELAPEFAPLYNVVDLGPVPGVPGRLGGSVVLAGDPNTLLIAGNSETSTGAIYSIRVDRDSCGHIRGWLGTAEKVADAPWVDANLAYGPGGVLFYTGWPVGLVGQLLSGATSPSTTTSLSAVGATGSAGGVGFVPQGLAGAGGLRLVTWPEGYWYAVPYSQSEAGTLFALGAATRRVTLPNNPGGFAYVPAGSPGFANQSILAAEWLQSDPGNDHVAVYEVDPEGDPRVETRREFFSKFRRPWGAYFEVETGDFLFLTWNAGPEDRVFRVQGFAKPPPPPDAPPPIR